MTRALVDFVTPLHKSAKRDYLARALLADKAECAAVARRFGCEYWDGDRKYGYGGYRYDGRWKEVARRLAEHYRLAGNARILDVGCGKGYLLYELKELLPGAEVRGIDISEYALRNAKPEIAEFLQLGSASRLPFETGSFDLVISLMTLHNLRLPDLSEALREIQRVSRGAAYISMESYRNELEKVNLLNWQLTCEAFFTPGEWQWLFDQSGYEGDFEFLYFE